MSRRSTKQRRAAVRRAFVYKVQGLHPTFSDLTDRLDTFNEVYESVHRFLKKHEFQVRQEKLDLLLWKIFTHKRFSFQATDFARTE
jgi:hypothetical protein